jgi:hypothetical protein
LTSTFNPQWAGKMILVLAAVGAMVTSTGCGYYSFSGAALPEHVNTIAIPVFDDQARSSLPNLADELTELLIERFVRQTRLSLVSDDSGADTVLSGAIDRYTNRPASVGGQERATLNRVEIGVTVQYADRLKGQDLVPRRSFSAFGEYDPVEDGLDGEAGAASDALTQIAEDIFNAATSNW